MLVNMYSLRTYEPGKILAAATLERTDLRKQGEKEMNPDSEKTPLKVVPSLAGIMLKNGDFTEEALGSTFKNRL